jgi:hypothetical protein
MRGMGFVVSVALHALPRTVEFVVCGAVLFVSYVKLVKSLV